MDDYIGNIDLMFDFFNRLGFDWEMSEEIFDTGAPASLTNFETPEGIDADYPTATWMAVNNDETQKEDWMDIFENLGHYRDSFTNQVLVRKPKAGSPLEVGTTYWQPKPDRAIFYDAELYASMGRGNNERIYVWSGWIAFVMQEGGVGSGGPIERLIKTRMEIEAGRTAVSSSQFSPQYSNMVLVKWPGFDSSGKPVEHGDIFFGEAAYARYSTLKNHQLSSTPDAINRWDL